MRLKIIDTSFLQGKVAKRFFLLFVACAIGPLAILTAISFAHVVRQLEEQSLARIQQAAKTHGISIYERLLSMEGDMQFISTLLSERPDKPILNDADNPFTERLTRRFISLGLISQTGQEQFFLGKSQTIPQEILNQQATVHEEKISIRILPRKDENSRVFMLQKTAAGLLFAEANVVFFWGIGYENILPPMTDLCILDGSRNLVTSSFKVPQKVLQKIVFNQGQGGSGSRQFEYKDNDTGYLASFWLLYLKAHFDTDNLTIMLRQAKAHIMAPMNNFKKIFPLVVLLALWFVLLLSLIFIRRTLVPLKKLKDATELIALRDFSSEVKVSSHDEFEELATAFNTMGRQLDRQFKTLLTISEISQAILSSVQKKQIVDTALVHMHHFFDSQCTSIFLLEGENSFTATAYSITGNVGPNINEEQIGLYQEDLKPLTNHPQSLILTNEQNLPDFLIDMESRPPQTSYLLLPLFVGNKLAGVISLGYETIIDEENTDILQARQLADQLAIALTNAALVSDLEELSWGTLQALARTVDAKSSWTAGHSERVTDLAVKIAHFMGCKKHEIDTLHRAALIHDIGKVGIPLSILDKPDRLDDAEYECIKEHPHIGARILSPLKTFSDIVPIVLYHHEKYDGTGYPHSLTGDEIPLESRILAVADVYDAVTSERPYRRGWVEERGVKLIIEQAGKHFDPEVVKAFTALVS